MVERLSWIEFKNSGLLFFVNQILHLFGRAIVFQYDITGSIEEVYFAKCKFRGFAEPVTSEGYKNLTAYLQKNIETISEDLDKE